MIKSFPYHEKAHLLQLSRLESASSLHVLEYFCLAIFLSWLSELLRVVGQHPRYVPSYGDQWFERAVCALTRLLSLLSHPAAQALSPFFLSTPQCSSPALRTPSVSSANTSSEWTAPLPVGLALCWNPGLPGHPPDPLCGGTEEENTQGHPGEPDEGLWNSWRKMCLPSLPGDQSLSPLAKFITGFPWKIHHCPSPAHLVFLCWVLLFKIFSLSIAISPFPFHLSGGGSRSP